ncbi:MAG TPA: succinate dehydrogenase, cytochrome b556 subunit [Steroidobacteraceae bacterium]
MRARPLSPHLTVYRMSRYTLVTSIVNRFSGLLLSAGLLLLVYWLISVAGGPKAYSRARALLSLPPLQFIYWGLLVAFCYHLLAGIRHLIWDTGHALERSQAQRSSWLIGLLTLALAIALGLWLVRFGGHAA